MNLRHIQAFIAVGEELHFGRAAKRLHIEQSPLSRTVRALESELGVALLKRTPRGARLTWAGQLFLEDARRIVLAFEQAQARARSAAAGHHGHLRIALADGVGQARLAALLALCREEAPEVSIRLFETSLAQMRSGLNSDFFDAGLALSDDVDDEISASPIWRDPLVLALPARHPLLAFRTVPLDAVVEHPLVLCHPDACEGCSRQIGCLLRSVMAELKVAEYVNTHALMMTLVAAGYGAGFSSAAHLADFRQADVVVRPLADEQAALITYLLRPAGETTAPLMQFIERAERIGRVKPAVGPSTT